MIVNLLCNKLQYNHLDTVMFPRFFFLPRSKHFSSRL